MAGQPGYDAAMDPSLENDPDILALKRAAANKRLRLLGLVGLVLALLPVYWLTGYVNVRSALERDGFTDVRVSGRSPFEFGFQARKGTSTCSGSVVRVPFSTSTESFCYDVDASGHGTGSLGSSSH